MQLLEWTMPKIPKVLCYRFYLLLKKLLQFCQCQADFKFNLFNTKFSRSLSSLKGDYIYCTREKVFCHSVRMQCYYTGNNLMGSAFKTEMPWGTLPFLQVKSLKGILAHIQKSVRRLQGWSPRSVIKVTEIQGIFQNDLMPPPKGDLSHPGVQGKQINVILFHKRFFIKFSTIKTSMFSCTVLLFESKQQLKLSNKFLMGMKINNFQFGGQQQPVIKTQQMSTQFSASDTHTHQKKKSCILFYTAV